MLPEITSDSYGHAYQRLPDSDSKNLSPKTINSLCKLDARSKLNYKIRACEDTEIIFVNGYDISLRKVAKRLNELPNPRNVRILGALKDGWINYLTHPGKLIKSITPIETVTNLDLIGYFFDPCGLFSPLASSRYHLTQFQLNLAAKIFPNVEKLDLRQRTKLEDAAIIALAPKLLKLTHIILADCPRLTDAAIIAIANNCRHLVSIDLTNCRHLTDTAIITLFKKCPNLAHLSLAGGNWTDQDIANIMPHCSNLISLSLAICHRLTDASLISVKNSCPNLETLDISDRRVKRIFVKTENERGGFSWKLKATSSETKPGIQA